MRDIVLQIRLNERERTKLRNLARDEQVTLCEWIRLAIRDAKNPTTSN